jgi:hypothetical protein
MIQVKQTSVVFLTHCGIAAACSVHGDVVLDFLGTSFEDARACQKCQRHHFVDRVWSRES